MVGCGHVVGGTEAHGEPGHRCDPPLEEQRGPADFGRGARALAQRLLLDPRRVLVATRSSASNLGQDRDRRRLARELI